MTPNRKSLKFAPNLVPLVLSGEKDCTWRLWDDKDLKVGDEVDLIARPELKVFAKAKITSVSSKTMGKLTAEDKKGHEPFKNVEEMYDTYSDYYQREVGPDSPVTVCRFRLIERN
jgi:hypothetical protein